MFVRPINNRGARLGGLDSKSRATRSAGCTARVETSAGTRQPAQGLAVNLSQYGALLEASKFLTNRDGTIRTRQKLA